MNKAFEVYTNFAEGGWGYGVYENGEMVADSGNVYESYEAAFAAAESAGYRWAAEGNEWCARPY